MRLPQRRVAFLLGFATVLTASTWPSSAQEPKPTDPPKPAASAPAARRAYDPSRRLPNFFGQIGLTQEQKDRVYDIRGKHQQRIGELEAQIAQARSEMMAECETQLTATQKELLAGLRRVAAERKKAQAPSAEKPAPKAGG